MSANSGDTTSNHTPSIVRMKPVIIGLYGLPGSGKTTLFNQLKQIFDKQRSIAFYEGSEVIDNIVPGGLAEFKKLDGPEKTFWRERAIQSIQDECTVHWKVGVLVGHFMFWLEGETYGEPVYTNVFTHILYLDVPGEDIAHRRMHDIHRSRPIASAAHLNTWQQDEKTRLRHLCRSHGILFLVIPKHLIDAQKLSEVMRDFVKIDESRNLSRAEVRLDEVLGTGRDQLDTVLRLDGDKTLAAEDTGALFWKKALGQCWLRNEECPLKALFSSPLGYSYTAFQQATLMYEETGDDEYFDAVCEEVASKVTMHPEFVTLLHVISEQKRVGAVVVTSGLRRVWEKVLEREGLSKAVKVIGGGRIADGLVVTAQVKSALARRLIATCSQSVCLGFWG